MALALLVVGVVGAFAIYTWGWRDTGGDRQRELARADFETVNYAWDSCCRVVRLDRTGDHTWRVTFSTRRKWRGFAPSRRFCYLLDLWRFKSEGDLSFAGWNRTGCGAT